MRSVEGAWRRVSPRPRTVWLDYLQVATDNDTHIAAALQHSGLGIAAGGMVALIAGAAPPLGVAITVLGFGSAGAPYLALAEASGRRKAQEVLREFMGWK